MDMAARKTETSASQLAWRRFQKTARLFREAAAAGDDELSALLRTRTIDAFEKWVAAEPAGVK